MFGVQREVDAKRAVPNLDEHSRRQLPLRLSFLIATMTGHGQQRVRRGSASLVSWLPAPSLKWTWTMKPCRGMSRPRSDLACCEGRYFTLPGSFLCTAVDLCGNVFHNRPINRQVQIHCAAAAFRESPFFNLRAIPVGSDTLVPLRFEAVSNHLLKGLVSL